MKAVATVCNCNYPPADGQIVGGRVARGGAGRGRRGRRVHRVVRVHLGEAHAVRRVRRVRQRRAAAHARTRARAPRVVGAAPVLLLLLLGEVVRPLRREEGLRVKLLQCGRRDRLYEGFGKYQVRGTKAAERLTGYLGLA